MGRIRVQTGARERSKGNEVERQKAKHNENKSGEVNSERGTVKEDGQVLRCPAAGEVWSSCLVQQLKCMHQVPTTTEIQDQTVREETLLQIPSVVTRDKQE